MLVEAVRYATSKRTAACCPRAGDTNVVSMQQMRDCAAAMLRRRPQANSEPDPAMTWVGLESNRVQAVLMIECGRRGGQGACLRKANVLGVLTEALTADVEAVLADDAPLVGTHPAARQASVRAGCTRASRRSNPWEGRCMMHRQETAGLLQAAGTAGSETHHLREPLP